MFWQKKTKPIKDVEDIEFENILRADVTPPPAPKQIPVKEDIFPMRSSHTDTDIPEVTDGGKVREIKQGEKISVMDRLKMGRHGDTAWVVTMLFSNGTCRQFVITTKEEIFKYKTRWYHLRYENSWFDLSFKYYRLFYFEDHVEPLDKEIIRKGDIAWWTVTPENIKPYTKQQYVKNLTESDITKWLKIIVVICGITLLVVFSMVAYFLMKGGVPGLTK
jgi:hypothetical protein